MSFGHVSPRIWEITNENIEGRTVGRIVKLSKDYVTALEAVEASQTKITQILYLSGNYNNCVGIISNYISSSRIRLHWGNVCANHCQRYRLLGCLPRKHQRKCIALSNLM